MSTHSIDYRDAVNHLPEGAILVLQGVSWEDYEQLLSGLTDRPGVRVTYDCGRLEIMSPLPEHEKCKEFIARVVDVLCDELDLNFEALGSTTWKRKKDARGTEPDTCFYIANAERITGKSNIDLNVDPPPDLVIEVDTTNESVSKFSIYAAFGMPEIWRYDSKRHRAVMYELRDQSYHEIPSSRSFPILTSDILSTFTERSITEGQKTVLSAFRQWVKQPKSK